MQAANVIPFPSPEPKELEQRQPYLIRHEDRTEVVFPEYAGRRVLRIRRTFFDGRDRVELALEKEIDTHTDVEGVLSELENVVSAYFNA